MSEKEWVCFHHPDGRLLCAYTVKGTFAGEAQATVELLAAENGIKPGQIKMKLQYNRPKEGKVK